MNAHMRRLEQRRMSLVAESHLQRQQLIEYGRSAEEAVRRFRLIVLAARGAAFAARLWNRFTRG